VNDDRRLITDALNGETTAFGCLVERYQSRLYAALVQLVSNREEAEDLMQEAFVHAFVKLETFRGDSAFFTWLYRIAYNLTIDFRRRRRAETVLDRTQILPTNEPLDTAESAQQRLERSERAEQLYLALDSLESDRRDILILRDIEGFSYQEVARILDLPIGTVRSRLHRARMELREQLQGVLHEPAEEQTPNP
jgi:RNA polymerase sigma-70 factor, ECF subfamily